MQAERRRPGKRVFVLFLAVICLAYYSLYSAHSNAANQSPKHAFAHPGPLSPVHSGSNGISSSYTQTSGGHDIHAWTSPLTEPAAPELPPLPPLPPSSLDHLSASLRSFIGNVENSLHEPPTSPPLAPPQPLPVADDPSTTSLPALPPLGASSLRSSSSSLHAASNYGAIGGSTAAVNGGLGVSGSSQASEGGEGGMEGDDDDATWCRSKASMHNVVPRKSWGNLPTGPLRDEWQARKCNKHLLVNKHREGGSGGAFSSGSKSSSSSSSGTGNSGTHGTASTNAAFAGSSAAVAAKAPADADEAWCRETVWKFDVRPGSTWGKLNSQGQGKWRALNCDEIVTAKAAFVDQSKLPVCSHINANANTGSSSSAQQPKVAVCCGTTTRKVTGPTLSKLALFRYLLPSMAHTLECGYSYMAVVGFDAGDPFYDTLHGKLQVEQWFEEHFRKPLEERGVTASLQLVRVTNPLKKPGPVFNAITRAAYDLGADYIYRVNDDTEMAVSWAGPMIKELASLDPPNVGAVGPLCRQGNTKILTHDFTHRTHMEIFGHLYYPPQLVDWWMDDWISRVYGSQRTRQGASVSVVHHTGAHGQRYQVDKSNKRHLERLLEEGKQSILKYLRAKGASESAIRSMAQDKFGTFKFKQF